MSVCTRKGPPLIVVNSVAKFWCVVGTWSAILILDTRSRKVLRLSEGRSNVRRLIHACGRLKNNSAPILKLSFLLHSKTSELFFLFSVKLVCKCLNTMETFKNLASFTSFITFDNENLVER